jgi:hypothetical protein
MTRGQHYAEETSCVNGHDFDEENTLIDSRGYRHCRTCKRERMHAYRTKRKNEGK